MLADAVVRPVLGAAAEAGLTTHDSEAVLELERPRLMALAYSVLHDPDEAADVVQDTFERALRAWHTLRQPGRRSAWLSTICVRRALRVHYRLLATSWLRHRGEEVGVLALTRDVDLERALRRLSARQRAVVALHYVYGYTLDEAAATIGCRPGTARSHLARALDSLRKEIER